MGDGGKGSAPRPFSVDQTTFGNNFDSIFGKNKVAETVCHCYTCTQDIIDHTLACTKSNEPEQPESRYR
jgi:hypothetical protein